MAQPIPPQSKESEMMILGCMLSLPTALNYAADALEEEDFYYTEHRLLFAVLKGMYKRDKSVNVHLTCEELKRLDRLDKVGGIEQVIALANYAGTSAYVEEYVAIVHRHSLLRRLIIAAQAAQKLAMSNPEDVDAALDEIQKTFYEVGQRAKSNNAIELADWLSGAKSKSGKPFLEELQARQELCSQRGPNDVRLGGLPTGFIDLDKMINGLGSSNLIILAARPAMGKTAFALNIAENIASDKSSVGIFSLEMNAEQVCSRLVCSQARVSSEKLTLGSLDGHEYQTVVSTANAMKQQKIIIDDQPGMRITDLRSRARRMKEQHGIKLLVIDYLQLLSGSGSERNSDGRQFEISEISRLLKTLARELDIPIICLSQLSRKVEDRPGRRPQMSDIRESGSIEQDADVVMLLYRRDYYDPLDKPGEATLNIAKNRHGGVGDIKLSFRKDYARFENYSREVPDNSSEWDSLGT